MINLLKNILKIAIGIISLPLAITASKAFYVQLGNMAVSSSGERPYFLWGAAAYIILHLFFFKPNFIYNLGHETVHVLFSWLSLGKARHMRVSEYGGSVQTTKSNVLINIGPYFVPIYTLILCGAYYLLSRIADASKYTPYFIFFIGFSFAMHILLTVEALKVSQPDLARTGYIFSLSLIYVINIFVAGLIISLIFTSFSFVDMLAQFWTETKELYILIIRQMFFV